MAVALVEQKVDEMAAMHVSKLWADMPAEFRDPMLFWYIVRAVQMQPNTIPLGPPTDIEWTISDDPAAYSAIELRHPCEVCRDSLDGAIEHVVAGETIGFVQFTQAYLRDVKDLQKPFQHVDHLVEP